MTLPKLLRRGQVERLLNVSRWTLARIIASDPTFPGFFELSSGIEVVRQDRVEAWLRLRELGARVPRRAERLFDEAPAPTATGCTQTHIEALEDAEHDADTGPRGADEGSTQHEDPAETAGPARRA
ncbi:MAG: helix-turn-helix transcriptional regulator [Rubrivivax sp.]|jgi:hypothetical protein|nr:hypothetical protein [Burkholderiaceae bacterium]MCZ8176489.1 hypothetical protein [Burkholderiaceae bacterium]